ncbi:Hypothetical predicted protein [Olea europaea subsp. europaea]|uniref:Uncharacterized protein n=1 Tax=Olea europaea subsp. europaea TaxID=158383 RepID=A0A8S0UPL7_OLEEU|nr:Hypothetical predicted protein [Olea europaea subsp. europaea]
MYNDCDDNNDVVYQDTSFWDVSKLVEARNYDAIQTPLPIDDVPPLLIDLKSIDRCILREKDGDTDNESHEDDDGIAESESVHRAEENNEALDDQIEDSEANILNRLKKKYNHRTGSRPFSYIVEKMAEDGSKFTEVDTFEFAYVGKNKCWTCNATKAQHDEMFVKEHEYLIERAKE